MINTFRTLFEARERKFQQERLFRGESVDLVARITTDGVMDTLNGYSISGVYQPTDDLSGDFYPLNAEISDGSAILHWTNQNDFGKDAYNVWGLLTKDGKAAYPICWRLMFAHSPSYPLGTPDPLPRTIDFSQYELLNAPWAMLSDLEELQCEVYELSDGLSAYAKKEDIPEVEGKYLPLSGGTVTGALSVVGTFESSNFKGDAGKGIMIGYNAKAKNGSIAIGSSSDVTNAHFGGSNVAIGTAAKIGSSSETDCAVAVGVGTTVNGNHGIAIGHSAEAEGANSIAIGSSGARVQALAPESIQIGGLSNGLLTPNNTPHSLKVFDKMVLSGDNLTLDPERIPYLSGYAQLSDIPDLPEDLVHEDELSDYVKNVTSAVQNISTPLFNAQPISAAALNAIANPYGTVSLNNSLDGSKTTLYPARTVIERVGGRNRSIFHYPEIRSYYAYDLSTYTLTIPYKNGTIVVDSDLSAYAQLSDIPEVPTDLSAFMNSPGYLTAHQDLTDYATKEFVQSEISDFITEDALTGLATKQELSDAIGDIDTILDFINGQTI